MILSLQMSDEQLKVMIYTFSCVKMPATVSDEKMRILTQVVEANKIEKNGQMCTNWQKVINSSKSQFILISIVFFKTYFLFQGLRRIQCIIW